jgi:hypothetical protein
VDLLLAESYRDELDEVVAALADHAESAVRGVDQRRGRLDHAPQHRRQIEVRADRHHGLEQRMRAIASDQHGLQAGL